MKTYKDDTELWVSLSGVTFHTPLSLLPVCLHAHMHSLLNLMGEEQWSLQHSHSPAESTRLSPAFLFPFISFSLFPPGKKTPATFFFFFLYKGEGPEHVSQKSESNQSPSTQPPPSSFLSVLLG